MTGIDILQLVANVTFVAAALIALRLWSRHPSRSAACMAGSMGSIGTIIVVGMISEATMGSDAELPLWLVVPIVAALLAAPYLLWRFAESLSPLPRRYEWWLRGAFLLALASMFTPGVLTADADAPRSVAVWVVTVIVLGYWVVAAGHAGFHLLRSGRARPGVAARRLRLLGWATLLMATVLVLSLFGGGDADQSDAVTILSAIVTAVAGSAFVVGFAPPPILRSAWRHEGERRAFAAAASTMEAGSVDEVIEILVGASMAVTGAQSVRLLDQAGGLVIEEHGEREAVVATAGGRGIGAVETEVRRVSVDSFMLEVELDPALPLFGDDDLEALQRITTVGTIALERAQLLESEQGLRRQLEHANQDLEAFISSTSHDMKNPLFAIRGFVDVLLAERAGPLPSDAVHYLERVQANVDFMDALIRDLLVLSRVGKMHEVPEAVSLSEILEQLGAGLRERWPQFLVVHGDLPTVWLSSSRAQQVFANLLENAAQYSGRDDVTVEITGRVVDADHVELMVADNGQGVPEDGQAKVFEPFARLVGKEVPGTGLGLSIVRRIIESAGGSIELVVPSPGQRGATFRIVLPRPPATSGDGSTAGGIASLPSTSPVGLSSGAPLTRA